MKHYSRLLFFLLISGMAPLHAETNEILSLLEKMAAAEQTLNYEGTFVYKHDNITETMQIVHSFDKNGERERLSSLASKPMEMVRDDKHVFCVLPTNKFVLIEPRDIAALAKSSFLPESGQATYYDFELRGTERVASYPCQILDISARDKYRYGYRLCIENETGLLLKSQTLDENGQIREQLVFTELRLPEMIPTESLQTTLHEEDFDLLQSRATIGEAPQAAPDLSWGLSKTPPGFFVTRNELRQIASSNRAVRHIVLNDGIASVSVFIGHPEQGEPHTSRRVAKSGALSTLSKLHDDFVVTVIGEVPGHTVEMIAQSLQRQTTAVR